MRLAVVLTAYLIAIVVGVFVYGVLGAALTGFEMPRIIQFVSMYLPFFVSLLIVNYWLTPFAVAGVIASELFRLDRWWPYPIGAAILGVLVCFQGLPYETERAPFWEMLPYYSSVMSGAVTAGLVYWFIAWRKWRPHALAVPPSEELE